MESKKKRGKPDENGLVSAAWYGRHRGVTTATVTYALKTGRISSAGISPQGHALIDPVQADKDWEANTDPKQSGNAKKGAIKITPPSPTDEYESLDADEKSISMAEANRRKAILQVKMMQLEYEEKLKQLVTIEDAKTLMSDVFVRVKQRIRNIPRRVAPLIVGESDEQKVQAEIEREIDDALTELSTGEFFDITDAG